MTLNLNARAALKYGLIWEFFAVPDSVSTRPFIIPPPLKTEFSSTPITQSPERKGTVDEDVFLDFYYNLKDKTLIMENTNFNLVK